MKSIRKKNLIIGTSVILLIGVGLYSLRFLDSSGERVLKTCLFEQVTKCGYVDFTEDEIVAEVRILDISKKQAKKLFLNAQERNQKFLDGYGGKQYLSDDEKRMKSWSENEAVYFQRALHALEKMED